MELEGGLRAGGGSGHNGIGGDAEEEKKREKSRVVVVSNRLPISAQRDLETGKWTFKMSSGGLVTALQGVRHEMDFLWIGWMGVEVEESERVSVWSGVCACVICWSGVQGLERERGRQQRSRRW